MNVKILFKPILIITLLLTLTIIAQDKVSILDEKECPSSVIYGGKTYNTVQIGDQCWFKESLDIGTMIKGTDKQTDNGVIEKYCYDNDFTNCDTYGALYLWDEAMQYENKEGAQGICPPGWHIPTSAELQTMIDTVGSNNIVLKAIGQGSGKNAGTNISGFSALLSGFRHFWDGSFRNLNDYVDFWSSTENGSLAKSIYMSGIYNDANFYYNRKDNGFCVRCLKD